MAMLVLAQNVRIRRMFDNGFTVAAIAKLENLTKRETSLIIVSADSDDRRDESKLPCLGQERRVLAYIKHVHGLIRNRRHQEIPDEEVAHWPGIFEEVG